MGFLFVTWIFLRNLLYAALQTNVIWTVAHSAVEPLEWMQVWWCLSVVHFVINFPRILRASDLKHLLPVDVGRFALSLWYGLISSILMPVLGIRGQIFLHLCCRFERHRVEVFIKFGHQSNPNILQRPTLL